VGAAVISTALVCRSKEKVNLEKDHVEFFATIICGCEYRAQECTVESAAIAGAISAHEDPNHMP
jgi:hypothetical protein